jgi:hypothetical protein
MTRMYDSVDPFDIPTDATVVAGYVDGRYAWTDAGWQRFSHTPRLTITVLNGDADVLDVETGDATPDEAVRWVASQRAAGRPHPGVYCNTNLWPTVRATFRAHQVPEPWYWVADYDGRPDIPEGAVAKQYIDAPGSGGHYDLTAISPELITYLHTGGKAMISPDDANLIATTILNWPITTVTKPTGSGGRPVWDVLGDGERVRADLLSDTTLVEDLVKALPAGGAVDPAALAADLAAPLASLLAPAITASESTPAQFFTALADQLKK